MLECVPDSNDSG